jgi:hypothetical protein
MLEDVSQRLEIIEAELVSRVSVLEVREGQAAESARTLRDAVEAAHQDLDERVEYRFAQYERGS